jgi:hypothetical protein
MKKKNLVLAGAFLGVFSLGAMFSPIGQSEANTIQNSIKYVPGFQTATANDSTQQTATNYSCPITGQPMGNGVGMMGSYFAGTNVTIIADALGITQDELQTALNSGKTISDLAEEKGVSVDSLVDTIIQSRKVDLEQAVTDGKITQEQMDYMLENMESHITVMIEDGSYGPQNGRGRGMGMMGGMGRGHMNFSNPSTY